MGTLELRADAVIQNEDLMERTLRWMGENLGGAHRATHPPEHRAAGTPCTNSGTGIIVCCYIDALGKVLLRGRGGVENRFRGFVNECMTDFMQAESTKKLPTRPGIKAGAGDSW